VNIEDGISAEVVSSEYLFVGFEILVIFIVDKLKNVPRPLSSFQVEK
jgi:hypothetical protein